MLTRASATLRVSDTVYVALMSQIITYLYLFCYVYTEYKRNKKLHQSYIHIACTLTILVYCLVSCSYRLTGVAVYQAEHFSHFSHSIKPLYQAEYFNW